MVFCFYDGRICNGGDNQKLMGDDEEEEEEEMHRNNLKKWTEQTFRTDILDTITNHPNDNAIWYSYLELKVFVKVNSRNIYRNVNGCKLPWISLNTIEVEKKYWGQGYFKRVLAELENIVHGDHPNIVFAGVYVQSITDNFLKSSLRKNGYTILGECNEIVHADDDDEIVNAYKFI